MYTIFTITCSLAATVLICVNDGVPRQITPEPKRVSVRHVAYHGWPDSIIINNGRVEAVVVPAVGLEQTSTYTLLRRTEKDPAVEAIKVFVQNRN